MKWLFVPLQSGKPWDGKTIHTEPLGGSEAAVAYTARALAKKGENVTVITHSPTVDSTYEDVRYINNAMAQEAMAGQWDVVVSSRWMEILENPWITNKLFLWLHDLPYMDVGVIKCHKVIMVSETQRTSWKLPDVMTTVIGNGIDLNLFESLNGTERNENKLMWTSNPDRGLPIAAKIFQEIRKRWPDLELHVYGRSAVYGWPDDVEGPFLPRESHMENITLHEPLPRYALAKELATAWCWYYPTIWPETYCIAGLEAQAAGTPIVAAPYAALNETVKGGILTHDFLNGISQLRNKRRWNKLSDAGKEFARENTWEDKADQWIEEATAQ
jgi:glycosyltransferase involved in cell wall biosynthesis